MLIFKRRLIPFCGRSCTPHFNGREQFWKKREESSAYGKANQDLWSVRKNMEFVCRVTVDVPGSHPCLTRTALKSTNVIENITGHGKRDSRAGKPSFYNLQSPQSSTFAMVALLTMECAYESLNSFFNANSCHFTYHCKLFFTHKCQNKMELFQPKIRRNAFKITFYNSFYNIWRTIFLFYFQHFYVLCFVHLSCLLFIEEKILKGL